MAITFSDKTPDLAGASLADIARLIAEKRLPPVDKWHPEHCGDSEMRITSDGTWFYRGSPIGRPALVRLFSTVLRREEDGSYVLVTPAEKLTIAVDDAPFVAVEATIRSEGADREIVFRLNEDTLVMAGPENPIRVSTASDGTPRPYVHVRGKVGNGLEALITRSVFYELANIALEESAADGPTGLYSGGVFHEFSD